MTTDAAALLCCCAGEVECCPLSSVLMSIQSLALDFDFQFLNPTDGVIYRRFTTTGVLSGGVYVQGSFGLSSSLLTPIVLSRVGANATDGAFGTLGRCGYRASRTFNSPSVVGWNGIVATVPASLPATPQNCAIWNGRAVPQGQTIGSVWYYIRPFRMASWNQVGAPWGFEVGVVCGQITAGVVSAWPPNGCPLGSNWSSSNMAGNFTYFRGKVRNGSPTFGSMAVLSEPTWNAQTAQLLADSFPQNPFQVSIA